MAERDQIVAAVREFVERDVLPVASALEHADEYPTELVATMNQLGLFGCAIPAEHGGLGLDVTTYALVIAELARGWMSLTGVVNGHYVASWMLSSFGTDEQRARLLPGMANGEPRGAFALTEPQAGSDLQAIRMRAERDGDGYRLTGQKMWITNALHSGLVVVLARTDPDADPPHRGMGAFLVEKEPGEASPAGLRITRLDKLGYKGVETCEVVFDGTAATLLGPEEGNGFQQFMAGLEVGRINLAARSVGLAQAAFEAAIRYAQQRSTFGKRIADHQAIQLQLAQMATKIAAARLLTLEAARLKDAGERADLEAGMAKYFASEVAAEVSLDAMRVHGGYGYSPDFVVERLYRDAPLLVIGEGTNEIQQLLIARRLLERYEL
jgi:alkylation response protein AidB-like acyl-CoA dehydrogenase